MTRARLLNEVLDGAAARWVSGRAPVGWPLCPGWWWWLVGWPCRAVTCVFGVLLGVPNDLEGCFGPVWAL